jgi:ABC-type antimicrobial peptide transport system permease subunit
MENNSISSYYIKQGLIFGLVNILLAVLIYLLGADFFATHFILVPVVLVLIAVTYPTIVTYRARKLDCNGLLSYGDAYQISFFMLIISGLITAAFGILLYHVIDPEYPKQIQEKMIEHISEYMSSAGMSPEEIETKLNRQEMAEKFTLMGQVKSFLFSIIFYAIISLLVALIARKKENNPFNSTI